MGTTASPGTTEELARAIKRGETFSPTPERAAEAPPAPALEVAPKANLALRLARLPLHPITTLRKVKRRLLALRPVPLATAEPLSPYRLLIDIQALQGPSAGRGIGRYTLNLIQALVRVRPDWQIELIANSALPQIPADLPAGLPVASFAPPAPDDIWGETNERAYADWLRERRPHAVLLTDLLTPPVVVPTLQPGFPPVLAILYDLIPLLFPQNYLTCPIYLPYYARRLRAMLACDGVLAISLASATDFTRLFGPDGPPTSNISGAVDSQFRPHPAESLPGWIRTLDERYGVNGDYLLYVGGPDHRKNLRGAVQAFAELSPESRGALKLVIACDLPSATREALARQAAELGLTERIVIAGRVSDGELIALYQLCRLFVFPSLYEGLGLPILEAMSCGSPVACGHNSSLPEFAGPLAYLGDAADPVAFAQAIEAALAEPRDLRTDERRQFAAGFSWFDTAERAAVQIERCTEAKRGRIRVAA